MYNFRKSKKGFTLIELMVVVAIIAVLSLLGIRVYTGQATKAKNASVQANIHSLATELGVQILDTNATTYDIATVKAAAAKAQISNPFTTEITGEAIIVVGPATSGTLYIDNKGQIYCSPADTDEIPDSVDDAYRLQGIGSDGEIFITSDVNFK